MLGRQTPGCWPDVSLTLATALANVIQSNRSVGKETSYICQPKLSSSYVLLQQNKQDKLISSQIS